MASASFSTTFGLTAAGATQIIPNYTAGFLIFHAIFAHAITSTRGLKNLYRLDHQVSPRDDLDKYGPAAVSAGKITQQQLDQLRRNEAAHNNSLDHFPLFAAALVLGQVAGVPAADLNFAGLVYTGARLAYFANYMLVTNVGLSYSRAMLWWTSTITCLRLIWRAGNLINGKGSF